MVKLPGTLLRKCFVDEGRAGVATFVLRSIGETEHREAQLGKNTLSKVVGRV